MGLLESEIGLEPYPIPEGLEGNCAVVGKGRNLQVRGGIEIRCSKPCAACYRLCFPVVHSGDWKHFLLTYKCLEPGLYVCFPVPPLV